MSSSRRALSVHARWTAIMLLAFLLLFLAGQAALAQTLSFTFRNPQLVPGPKLQFEVWMKSSVPGKGMGDMMVYINYDTTVFGSSVGANGKATATKNSSAFGVTYLSNPVNDNTSSRFAWSWTNNIVFNNGTVIPDTGNGILAATFQMTLADSTKPIVLSFDALMNGEQFFDNQSDTSVSNPNKVWPALNITNTLNFGLNRITISKFQSTSVLDTSSATIKAWTLKLKTGSVTGGAIKTTNTVSLDTIGLADGTYFACEVDSAGWAHVGRKLDLQAAVVSSTDTCITVTVVGGQQRTVKFWNYKLNTVVVQKFQGGSASDTSSTAAKVWRLRVKTGSATGTVVTQNDVSTLTAIGLADGTYAACEADSAGWTHIGRKLDTQGAVLSTTDTCVTVTVAGSQTRTVKFWNFKRNTITVQKFRATATADSSTTNAQTWGLKLKSGSVAGGILASGNVSTLTVDSDSLPDGTYFACEVDSTAWTHTRSQVAGSPTKPFALGDTCIPVTVSGGQARTVRFWNSPPGTIIVQKFQAASPTDTASTLAKVWRLTLKTGSATGGVINQNDASSLATSGLADGTYFACEADSGTAWKHVGYKGGTAAAVIATDSCVSVNLSGGQTLTARFWNFKRNTITVQKFRSTSTTDSSTTNAQTWGLKLKSGSVAGGIVASASLNTLTVDGDSLPDGTYFACEADSTGWGHTRSKLDNNATKAFAPADTCIPVSVSNGQNRTVKFWNFHRNTITVQKFQASSTTDSSTSNQKTWRLKLKSSAATGGIVAQGDLNTLKVDTDSLPDGTYFACEADSTGWTHTLSQVVGSPTKSFVTADTCISVSVSNGQSQTVRFWNFKRNAITVKKFQASSATDSSESNLTTWSLKLKNGSPTGGGSVIVILDASSFTASNFGDGTYSACEADSTGWFHTRSQVTGSPTKAFTPGDTCIQVTVNGGENKTVQFWNMTTNVVVKTKVFLQGPYSGGTMTTTLRSNNYIPNKHPYSGAPWNYTGTDSVANAAAIPDSVTDWVLLELRSGTSSATRVKRRAAFVTRNGIVVDLDGTSPVRFDSVGSGFYRVVVWHRNHLAIMTKDSIFLSPSSALYNFTTAQTQAYGTNPMFQITTGVFAMWSGDVNADGQLKYNGSGNDRAIIFNRIGSLTGIVNGYYPEDVNMDGQVKYNGSGNDRALIFNNIGTLTGIRNGQVPP